jgi:large subunit ribosomal protein L31
VYAFLSVGQSLVFHHAFRNCEKGVISPDFDIQTGQQQRIIDIEGQVDRFYKKLQARQDYVEGKKAKVAAKISPDRSVKDIGLPVRASEALEKAGLDNVGKLLEKLAEGEAAILAIEGFGRKSLIDMKKNLRQMGYTLPSAAEEIVV